MHTFTYPEDTVSIFKENLYTWYHPYLLKIELDFICLHLFPLQTQTEITLVYLSSYVHCVCFKGVQLFGVFGMCTLQHFFCLLVSIDFRLSLFSTLNLYFYKRRNQWEHAMIRAMPPKASHKHTFFVHLNEDCQSVTEHERWGEKKEEGTERCVHTLTAVCFLSVCEKPCVQKSLKKKGSF